MTLIIVTLIIAEAITLVTERGEVYGNGAFHNLIGSLVDQPIRATRHGGDRKSEKYKNQAGLYLPPIEFIFGRINIKGLANVISKNILAGRAV